jgi:protein-disulfide isomerase
MAEEISIKKSTYNKILVAVIVLAVAFSFAAGFILGGGATGRATGTTTVTQTTPTQTQPTQPTAPSRAQVSLDDDPRIGDANAEVVVIEFSDFQCPFCRRFYTQTLSQLESEYINTGKVQFVYRDFPLDSIHPAARPAAIAAECAEEQGKWREYHNKIFDAQNEQGSGTIQFGVTELKQWAADVGLNTASFNSCLDSNKYDSEVSKDFQDGVNAGVSGTPTFYIGNAQRGYVQLVGAQPYSVIKAAIDQELAS